MRAFTYDRATIIVEALAALQDPQSQLLAGGTELVNWLKEGIESPARLVDITGFPLSDVESTPDGLRIGALARMSDVGGDPVVARRYPALAESLLRAASPQLRNMASRWCRPRQRWS